MKIPKIICPGCNKKLQYNSFQPGNEFNSEARNSISAVLYCTHCKLPYLLFVIPVVPKITREVVEGMVQ